MTWGGGVVVSWCWGGGVGWFAAGAVSPGGSHGGAGGSVVAGIGDETLRAGDMAGGVGEKRTGGRDISGLGLGGGLRLRVGQIVEKVVQIVDILLDGLLSV